MPALLARSRAVRAALLLVALALAPSLAAQVRERPVPFDSAGRIMAITPPLVARLGLTAPAWPVGGDFLEARLYEVGDSAFTYVLVVRRQREVLERFPVDAARRAELMMLVSRGAGLAARTQVADSTPTYISEPVRGQFIANQAGLGLFLFGPAAAGMLGDYAAGTAAYLAVAGGTFFYAANLTRTTPVSRAQNHLSAHSAVRGALAANLGLFAIAGDQVDGTASNAVTLVGGVLGDVVGFQLAKPMTDAEAHGTAHGSTVAALTSAGALGMLNAYENEGTARVAAAGIIAAGALGYPLGLRYVRAAPYRVTAGDVSAMFTAELLGVAAVATVFPDDASAPLGFGLLTAGYVGGVVLGDRLLVRPFDHTESEARLLALGTGAGALMGIALPVLAQTDEERVYFGMATIGGVLGAMATQSFIKPARAGQDEGRRTGSVRRRDRLDVSFTPQAALMAGSGIRGKHSVLSLRF